MGLLVVELDINCSVGFLEAKICQLVGGDGDRPIARSVDE